MSSSQEQQENKDQENNLNDYITVGLDHYKDLLKTKDEYVKLNQAFFLHQINTDKVLDAIVIGDLQSLISSLSSLVLIMQTKQKLKNSATTLDIEQDKPNPEKQPSQEDEINKNK